MRSIQSKILLVVITALFVITAVVTTIAVSVANDILHRDADRILRNVAQKEAAALNHMLGDMEKSAAIMEHFAATALQNKTQLTDAAKRSQYLAEVRHMFDEVALNTSGTKAYYLCIAQSVTGKPAGFFSLFLEEGTRYALSSEEFAALALISEEQEASYESELEGMTGIWMEPHPSQFSKKPVISHIVPLYHKGSFVGVIGFNMDFDYLLDTINAIDVYENGYVLLLSEDKSVCYNDAERANAGEHTGRYAHAAVPLVNGMHLELRADYEDIQSGLQPLILYIIAAFLIVMCVVILLTILVTRRIVRPLKTLTEAAQHFSADGQVQVELLVSSRDEIGTLSGVLIDAYGKIREYAEHINKLAYQDSMTGVRNHTAYTEAVEALEKEIGRQTPSFGVMVVDVNNLKQANDWHGHGIGNELIIHAAAIMTDIFKSSEVYRIGGDEFVVILRYEDLTRVTELLGRLDAAVAGDAVALRVGTLPLSIARGVAVFEPDIDRRYADVFVRADQAMYVHKQKVKAALAVK